MKKSILVLALIIGSLQGIGQFTKRYDFEGSLNGVTNGQRPYGTPVSDGTHLYGMTSQGGTSTGNFGVIFKIKKDGSQFQKLLDFEGITNGGKPVGSLCYEGGVLYGMTEKGGINNAGVIFKLMPDGSGYTKLKDFGGFIGWNPKFGSLISEGSYLYGMTVAGGTSDNGTIFRIRTDGSDYATLWNFDNPQTGRYPYGSLLAFGGLLYGTTESGGANGLGVMFSLSPADSTYTKLFDFDGATTGHTPYADLVSDGNSFYGLCEGGGAFNKGVLYKINPDGTGFVNLLDFDNVNKGANPYGKLTLIGQTLYGMASRGGSNNVGVLYRIQTDGSGFTKLIDFENTIGKFPYGGFLYEDGLLYGMASEGGSLSYGTIFTFNDLVIPIDKEQAAPIFQVHPNPSEGQLTVHAPLTQPGPFSLKIHNLHGDLVYTASYLPGAAALEMDLSAFAKGMYLLTLSDGVNRQVQKIVLH